MEDLQAQYETELKVLHEIAPETIKSSEEPRVPLEQTVSSKELWTATIPQVIETIIEFRTGKL